MLFMKGLLLFVCLATFFSCNSKNRTNSNSAVEDSAIEASSTYVASEVANNGGKETLNDIRFGGWTKKEWADNEYIRTVRKYIDAYNSGKIKDANLDVHKKYIQCKFVIADIDMVFLSVNGQFFIFLFIKVPRKISAHFLSFFTGAI